MSVPRSARSSSADSSSTACTRRGSLLVLARRAPAPAPRARSPSSRRTRPSAFDTTLCATTSTSVSGEVRRRGGGDQLGEVVARPDRRQRRERGDAERAQADACTTRTGVAPGAVELAERAAGGGRLAAAELELGDQLREVGRGVHVERQARHVLHAVGHARLLGRGDVAREAARPEARLDRVRRRQHERVRAGAVAVGDDHDRASARRAARPARRAHERRVPGHEHDAVVALRERVPDADRAPPRNGPPRSLSRSTVTRSAAAADSADAVGRHDRDRVELGHAPERAEHVREHRLRQRLARPGAERLGEPLLCGTEALYWKDRERSHLPDRTGARETTAWRAARR